MKLRQINRAVHRDLGYFFFGMCIIYGISGITLNHRHHWNPNYIITKDHFQLNLPKEEITDKDEHAIYYLNQLEITQQYRNIRVVADNLIIYFDRGRFDRGRVVQVNTTTGDGYLEVTKRIPVLYQFNFLHYNAPKKLWTWFSDLFAAGLIVFALTGLYMNRGKNSFKRRGIWFTIPGILIPLVFLYFYLT
ncbi:MAG: PepSY-associated TM helix domain-containing protein [Bacteroidetes bacterium]|nr:PepSY-associated TM helix domain-containing protein [Bacteroidota bacterium]